MNGRNNCFQRKSNFYNFSNKFIEFSQTSIKYINLNVQTHSKQNEKERISYNPNIQWERAFDEVLTQM